MAAFNCLYDLAESPVTFDFAIFLAVCEYYRRSTGCDSIALTIRNKEFRNRTPRDKHTSLAEKQARVYGILLPCCALLPSVTTVTLTDQVDGQHIFPPAIDPAVGFYTAYLARALVEVWEPAHGDPRCLTAPARAKDLVAARYPKPYVTLTLRTSTHAPERNPVIEDWKMFARWLEEQGYWPVFVPDTEVVLRYDPAAHPSGRFAVDIAAALDVRLRLALYEGAIMNVGSSNGPIGMAFFSKAPLLQFDHLRSSKFDAAQWQELNGFAVGGQFPWSAPNQRMRWVNSTFENLRAEFERALGWSGC